MKFSSILTMPRRCQSLRHLLTLSRDAPTMLPSSRCESDLRRRATFRVGLGRRYAQHRLGEARRQLEQRHLGDVLVGDAKPFAQDLDEPQPRLRMTLEEGQHLAPVEHREAALGERARVRGPPLAVEHGDFPEDFARMQNGEHDLLAFRRGDADAHAAAEHGHHAVAGVIHHEDVLARGKLAHMRARHQRVALLGAQPAEEHALAEQAAGFFQLDSIHRFHGRISPDGSPQPSGSSGGRRKPFRLLQVNNP